MFFFLTAILFSSHPHSTKTNYFFSQCSTPSCFQTIIFFPQCNFVFRPPSCFRTAILFTDHHLIFSPPYCFLTTILFLNVILFFISILFSSDAILFYHDNYFVCKGKHLNLFTFILNLIKSLSGSPNFINLKDMCFRVS